MAKLPKKTTMKETIERVMGYSVKMYHADKITEKQYVSTIDALKKLVKAIDK